MPEALQPDLPVQPPLQATGKPIVPEVMDRAYYLRQQAKDGIFSGERFKEMDPERYAVIEQLLAEQIPRRYIAKICKVSAHTVQAIAESKDHDAAALRKLLGKKARFLVRLCMERIEELLLEAEAIDGKVLTAIVDKLGTYAELLDGNPTARIASETGTGGGHGDYVSDLAALREQWQRIRDKVADRQMDAEAEKSRPIGAASASGAALPAPGAVIDVPAALVRVGPATAVPGAVQEPAPSRILEPADAPAEARNDLQSLDQASQPHGGQ